MIDQTEGMRVFGPFHRQLRRIINESWLAYEKILKEYPFFADDKTARANVVHAKAKALSHEEFDSVAVAKVVPLPPSSFMIAFYQQHFMRIKKLDSALRPDNVVTDQNEFMMAQSRLPGFGPKPCYPIAGYVLNGLETAIESIHITLPLSKHNLWSYEIKEDGEVGEVIVMPTIFPLNEPTKTKVQPKPNFGKKDQKKKEEKE